MQRGHALERLLRIPLWQARHADRREAAQRDGNVHAAEVLADAERRAHKVERARHAVDGQHSVRVARREDAVCDRDARVQAERDGRLL